MEILDITNFIGLFAFAAAGVLAGMRQKFDFVGAFFCGFSAALGGGITRDAIINIPSQSFQSASTLIFVSITIVLAYIFANKLLKIEKIVRIADAIGLATFSVVGAQIALSNHIPALGSVLLGVITGVGGGIIQQILTSKIPLLFQKELYALGAFLGASGFVFFESHQLLNTKTNLIIWALFILVFRLITIYKNVHLPIKTIES